MSDDEETYPPELSEDQLEHLVAQIHDYQVARGSLLKIPRQLLQTEAPVAVARTVGASVFPTPFPRRLFTQALAIQPLYNELYMRVAEDAEWLEGVLAGMSRTDEFTATLLDIWRRSREGGEVQPVRCGVWRSDYMLQRPGEGSRQDDDGNEESDLSGMQQSQIKQVEFNTYSCAGGTHGNVVADMHRYIACRGGHASALVRTWDMPRNTTVKGIAEVLERAHRMYGEQQQQGDRIGQEEQQQQRGTAVLMTVQPNNINTCDERPIEYGLGEDCDPPVPLYRVCFGEEILLRCSLGPTRELLFRPPTGGEAVEISVVYQRAGYDAHEYTPEGIQARLLLERSRAIKCPTVAGHLAGFKKVQQELCTPGILERFVTPREADVLRETFVGMYAMDKSGEGLEARAKATNATSAAGYILKPSLEGGGHNVHGQDIAEYLKGVPEEAWGNYILMEKIRPPLLNGMLVSSAGVHEGSVISELGVFGSCIWRRHGDDAEVQVLSNEPCGWSFKTKAGYVDEMSVFKGFGCYDCPLLLSDP